MTNPRLISIRSVSTLCLCVVIWQGCAVDADASCGDYVQTGGHRSHVAAVLGMQSHGLGSIPTQNHRGDLVAEGGHLPADGRFSPRPAQRDLPGESPCDGPGCRGDLPHAPGPVPVISVSVSEWAFLTESAGWQFRVGIFRVLDPDTMSSSWGNRRLERPPRGGG